MDRMATVFDKIVEAVEASSAKNKVLVVAGDIYDGKMPTEEERNLAINFVVRILELGVHVVVISGNHDFRDENGVTMIDGFHAIARLSNSHLHVHTTKPGVVDIDELGVSFLCIPCHQHLTTKKLKQMLMELRDQAKHELCYGVVHEAINGSLSNDVHRMKTDCDVPSVKGIRGIMLGDIHIQQRLGEGVWYAGSPYQTRINEPTKKGILVWTPDQVEPKPLMLKGIPKLIRVTDPKELKKYEGTKHDVKYVGTERVETDAPNITVQPNLQIIEESGKVKQLMEETRHSALIGLKEHLRRDGLSDDEIRDGYREAKLEVSR
jgi:DNA repair exonuclease SbcCD nuclease subunit